MTDANQSTTPPRELVVLIHGFAASRWIMKRFERHLKRAGYRVLNWGYPSFVGSLERHAARLRARLGAIDADEVDAIHVVAHSMGTIITRMILLRGDLPGLGRVVLIAPPNRGSHVARWVGRFLRPICPGVWQLSSAPGSFVRKLPPPDGAEIGVIAARWDYMVPRSSTHLTGQADHITLPGLHSSLLFQKGAMRQIERFLKSGRFEHDT